MYTRGCGNNIRFVVHDISGPHSMLTSTNTCTASCDRLLNKQKLRFLVGSAAYNSSIQPAACGGMRGWKTYMLMCRKACVHLEIQKQGHK